MSDLDDLDDLGPVKTSLFKNPVVLLTIAALAGGSGWFAYTQANPTADDWVSRGTSALASNDADGAANAFRSALALEADRMDAVRGVAEAMGRKKDSAAQVVWLAKAAKLKPASKEDALRIKQDLAKAALAWAALVKDKDDAAYDKALTTAAKSDSRSAAHGLLAAHLMALSAMHSTRQEYDKAAAAAKRARTLEIKKKDKLKAFEAQANAHIAKFAPGFAAEFKTKHEEALVKAKQFDTKSRGFYVKIVSEMPWSGSTRTAAQVKIHEVSVMNQANKLVRDALLKVLLGVAGSGASMDVLAKLPSSITEWEQQTWTEGWVRAPTKYALGIVVPFKDATRLVWLMRHGDSLLKGD